MPGDATAPTGLRLEFWRLVVIINVGVLAVSLGGMLLVFTDRARDGLLLVAVGTVALAYAFRRYRSVRAP